MADLNGVNDTLPVRLGGVSTTSGLPDNYADVTVNGQLLVLPADNGPVVPGTAASYSALIGGQYNSTLPTLTTGQQSAIQVDSRGRILIVSTNFPTTVDTNYGTVGANTLRTASQIGNATGGADFAAGNSSAQTLRVVVATNQATLPISAASLPLPTGASTEATLAKLPLAQASTTSGQYGILVQGAVTTTAPTYFNGATSPLSLTTTGALRVDNSAVTQPVIGTLTNNSSSPLADNVGVLGAWAQNTVNPSRYTSNTQVLPIVDIAGNTNVDLQYFNSAAISASNPVITTLSDGVHTLNQAFSSYGTAPIGTYVQGVNAYITNAPEISAVYNSTAPTLSNGQLTPLQTDINGNLKISGTFSAINLSVSQIAVTSPSYATNVGGAVTTAAPSYVSGQLDALSLTTAGALRVDGSGVTQPVSGTFWQATQPVSGTVTVNQGTANATPWNENVAQFGGSAVVTGTGASGAGIPRVTVSNDSNILATQSGTWTVEPGNTANTTAWFVKDNSLGTVAAGTAGTQSSLVGGVFNTALPTLTTGQQVALQLDSSGRLIIAPTTQGLLAEDHNYGTVGANTLRTASQIGNATGAADFAAGNSSAQTLRVVIATNQAVLTIQGDSASGAAKAGNPVQIGGVFNTTQPTVTTGETVEAQSTARGALIVATGVDAFNIDNITGTVSLPTGASTSANQATEITSLQLIDNIVGSGPGAGTAGTGSALMGGVFNTALPTLTNGQQAAIQLDSSGRLIIAPLTNTSVVKSQLQDNAGNGLTSTTSGAYQSLDVMITPPATTTYMAASGNFTPPATPTDMWVIQGSGTKTIKILSIKMSTTQTTAGTNTFFLKRYSTADTAGTATTIASFPLDTNNAAATATIKNYTANPTLGTLVGSLDKAYVSSTAVGGAIQPYEWDFTNSLGQPLTLRGAADQIAINFNGAALPAGLQVAVTVMYLEV
jgi:hypothetical protein